jgi:probable HAF family extracellular repeat protein
MKNSLRILISVVSMLLMIGVPIQLRGQETAHHHYQLVDLGTFGGPTSLVNAGVKVINGRGTIVGAADTFIPTPEPGCYNPVNAPDCFVAHAFAWRDNYLKDLGTLPGANYSFALEINERGTIAGVSEIDRADPSTGNPEFHAVRWQDDKIQDLGTLGGTSSFAGSLNNHGQIVGQSLNGVPDPLSALGLASGTTLTQTRAFIWENGHMKDLGTLGGPDSWSGFVNDRGQVAGASYTNDVIDPTTGTPQIDLFLWENGTMKDLGTLGGNNGFLGLYGVVTAVNDRGQITGGMFLAGDQILHAFFWSGNKLLDVGTLGGSFSYARGISGTGDVTGIANLRGDQANDAFLWRNGILTDLGTLGDDPCSDGLAVNSRGQVVGASKSTAGGCGEWTTAFLWENGGPMVDLNSVVSGGSGVHLTVGLWANERGEIVAGGLPPGCESGQPCSHTYALIPCDEDHPGIESCDYSLARIPAQSNQSNRTLSPSAGQNVVRIADFVRQVRRFRTPAQP